MTQFSHANVSREIEVYGYDSVIKSHCRMCHGGCGVLVYVKDGKVAKIAGDPDCPINHGTLCSKGIGSLQLVYHPDRLTHPIRRSGPKGSGKWRQISWDEALDSIAERIMDYKESFGAESIVMGYGTGRDTALALGMLNVSGADYMDSKGRDQKGSRSIRHNKAGGHTVGRGHRTADQLCRQRPVPSGSYGDYR